MRHKLPLFLFSSAIIIAVFGFFKNNPPTHANTMLYYPVFAGLLVLLALGAAFIWIVVVSIGVQDLICNQRRYTPPAWNPMPDEATTLREGEPSSEDLVAIYDATVKESEARAWAKIEDAIKKEVDEAEKGMEVENISSKKLEYGVLVDNEATLLCEEVKASEDVHSDEEKCEYVHEEDALPKEDFAGYTEAPTPPVAPHEDPRDPNWDAAAGRVIFK